MTYSYGDIVVYYNHRKEWWFVGICVETPSPTLFRMWLNWPEITQESKFFGVKEDLLGSGHTPEVIGNMKDFDIDVKDIEKKMLWQRDRT